MEEYQFNEAVVTCADNKVSELLLYSRGHWNGESKYIERYHWDFRMHSSEDKSSRADQDISLLSRHLVDDAGLGQHPAGFDTAIEALCHFTQFLIKHSDLH